MVREKPEQPIPIHVRPDGKLPLPIRSRTKPIEPKITMKKLNRRNLIKLSLLPAALVFKSCASPAQRSQTRQEARVQGRTEQRQKNRRGW